MAFDNREYSTKFLADIGATGYAFVDEEVARTLCERLQMRSLPLPRPKHLSCFDGARAKPITHVIFPKLTVQNHTELSTSMFITKIGSHPIILGKPWMNAHGVILNMKTDSLIFKRGRCNHFDALKKTGNHETSPGPPKELWLPPPLKPLVFSPSSSLQKYIIMQRRQESSSVQTSLLSKDSPPLSIVKDASGDEDQCPPNILGHDAQWVLMSADEPIPPDLKALFEDKDEDEALDIAMIGAAAFHRLAHKKDEKKVQMFSISMQQIAEALAEARGEAPRGAPHDSLDMNAILLLTMEEIKLTPRQVRWVEILVDYNIQIQ